MNRLTGAQEVNGTSLSWQSSGTHWQQKFSYDRYGNRAVDTANTASIMIGPNPQVSTSTNRITPRTSPVEYYEYDPAGNLKKGQIGDTFAFDAENKLVKYQGGATQTGGADYLYDEAGNRVMKATPSETLIYVYNIDGQLAAEYTTSTPQNNGTRYLTSDHLGTPRVNTKADGIVSARHDYLPFGEELYASAGSRTSEQGYDQGSSPTDKMRHKFTSKERDSESGLDFFGSRYYASAQGRFTSVDPIKIKVERLYDPIRLNLYSYCRNNPVKYIDPDGADLILGNKTAETQAQANIDRLLPNATERNNIRVNGNRVEVVNPEAVDSASASSAYRGLTGVIADQKVHTYYGLTPGESQALATPIEVPGLGQIDSFNYDDVRQWGGQTVLNENGNTAHFVAATDDMTLTEPAGNEVPFPQFRSFYHEVVGHQSGTSDAVKIENEMAKELGLPLRSQDSHEFDPTKPINVNVTDTGPSVVENPPINMTVLPHTQTVPN